MGWDTLNLLSTIGSYVLAFGILVVVANVLWSLVLGRAGRQRPLGGEHARMGDDLAAAAVQLPDHPRRSQRRSELGSRRPREDERRLERGELLLPDGHETVATSEVEADLEGVLRMPGDSVWPLILAICVDGLLRRADRQLERRRVGRRCRVRRLARRLALPVVEFRGGDRVSSAAATPALPGATLRRPPGRVAGGEWCF